MPRIATALGVWIAVVFSIGFNIAHYPVVWEMLAASAGPPASRATASSAPADCKSDAPASKKTPAASASKAATSGNEAVTDRAASPEVSKTAAPKSKPRVQCDGTSCKLVPAEEPAASTSTAAVPSTPAAAPASPPIAQQATAQPSPPPSPPATTSAAPSPAAPSPVAGSPVKADRSDAPDQAASPAKVASKAAVRRLPQVSDEVQPVPTNSVSLSGGGIPLYASTGVE